MHACRSVFEGPAARPCCITAVLVMILDVQVRWREPQPCPPNGCTAAVLLDGAIVKVYKHMHAMHAQRPHELLDPYGGLPGLLRLALQPLLLISISSCVISTSSESVTRTTPALPPSSPADSSDPAMEVTRTAVPLAP